MELQKAMAIAEELKSLLEPACERVEIAGSVRRQKPEVGDIEQLVIPKHGGLVGEVDHLNQEIVALMRRGVLGYRLNKLGSRVYGPKNKLMVHLPSSMAVDIFSSTEKNLGMALFVRTGPKEWNIKAMSRFRELGMQGHAYVGISRSDESGLDCPDEETVFRYLGWAYVPPQRRV